MNPDIDEVPISDHDQAALYEFTRGTPHHEVVRTLYRLAYAHVNDAAHPSAAPHAEPACKRCEALEMVCRQAKAAGATEPHRPDGSTLAINLAIDALENEPPEGRDWPVNWKVVVYGLKLARASLAASAAPQGAPSQSWQRLYTAVSELMAYMGAHGSADAKGDRASAVMEALHAIDGGHPAAPQGAQPAEPSACNLCAKGVPLEDGEHYGTQSLGMIPNTRCTAQSADAAPVVPQEVRMPPAEFEAWLCEAMPAGTQIGNPRWWAPRIWRAAMNAGLTIPAKEQP